MQKNKRYEWDKMEGCEWIRDTEMVNQPLYYDLETVASLLNQQDKRIKELKEENQQLKQTHKQLIINVLENIMSLCRNGISDYYSLNYVCTIIDNQIEKLKGEKR